MKIYRADTRTAEELKTVYDGFGPKQIMQKAIAMKMIMDMFTEGSKKEIMDQIWGADPRWVSTATDEHCMGQSGGRKIFCLEIPNLRAYKPSRPMLGILPPNTVKKFPAVLAPTLLMNSSVLRLATIFGVKQPRGTEVTFFTKLPYKYFTEYTTDGRVTWNPVP